jgi:hypothetical protein
MPFSSATEVGSTDAIFKAKSPFRLLNAHIPHARILSSKSLEEWQARMFFLFYVVRPFTPLDVDSFILVRDHPIWPYVTAGSLDYCGRAAHLTKRSKI